MVYRPSGTNLFEFVTVSSIRAAQLLRRDAALVALGPKAIVTAQQEVADGRIRACPRTITVCTPVVMVPTEFDAVRHSGPIRAQKR